MKYAGLKLNDVVDCESGICVSVWMQGCPYHCKGCHNPQTWDPDGGIEVDPDDLIHQVIHGLTKNGIHRDLSILGGEPLYGDNIKFVGKLITTVKLADPNTKIYIWTGNTLENLLNSKNEWIHYILNNIDVLIDGPFIEEQKDITLPMCGSPNQRVLYKGVDF